MIVFCCYLSLAIETKPIEPWVKTRGFLLRKAKHATLFSKHKKQNNYQGDWYNSKKYLNKLLTCCISRKHGFNSHF